MKAFLFLIICFWKVSLWSTPWAIVANGPFLSLEKLKDSLRGRKILVLDGAINRFTSLPFYPDCLLGDFDSIEDPSYWGVFAMFSEINEYSFPYLGNFGITIIPAKDQDYTDLEKGIIYCDKEGASSIMIVQATGGRMDHTLGNLGLLRKYHRAGRDMIIQTEEEQIIYLADQKILVEGGFGGTCAIMGYPQALMTTSGLAYNGDKYPLQIGMQESVCNTIIGPKATIAIDGEALIILPRSSAVSIP